ncbi:ABC transporter permease [Anaerotalea alkaliphila]|uniref:ABC transporter permease n=1 Tax=Anaerotalea alkaliphila TaxID=2662126 RepID=UPI0031B56D21
MPKRKIFSKLYMVLIFALLYVPILVLIVFSFNTSKLNAVWTGFTLDWYRKLMGNRDILRAMGNSLQVAFLSTALSTMVGTLAAVGMYRYKFKGKAVLDNLLYIPMVIPEIVLGIALLMFFSRFRVPLGIRTLVIAHATFSIPFVFITVKSRMAGFDSAIEEAAMDLGASPLQTFLHVTLPVILPGVAAGALLSFTLSIDDVITSFFVTGPSTNTFPLQVYSMVKFGVSPEINALSTVMLVITITVALLGEKLKKE